MAHKGREYFTNKEDVLISRGANPRTGLITPFVSDEFGPDSDEGDYVGARNMRKDCESVPTAQGQWRQGHIGWSLVENGKNHSISCDASDNAENGEPVREAYTRTVRYAGGFVAKEARDEESRTGTSQQKQSPPTQSACQPSTPRQQMNNQKRIVLSPVGAPRATSMPTPKEKRGAAQIFGHLKRMSGAGKKVKRAQSSASLDLEDTALGFQAYPSTPSKCRSTKYDQALSPSTPQPPSSKIQYQMDDRGRRICSLNDYVASIETLPQSRTPDLGRAYRRPKRLLPEHLREPLVPSHDASLQCADSRKATTPKNHHMPADMLPGQRPHIRRNPATTAIHRLDAVEHKATSGTNDKQTFPPSLQEREASAHTPSSGSISAARKAFLKFLGPKPHRQENKFPQPQKAVKHLPPLLSSNGGLLPDQPTLANERTLESKNSNRSACPPTTTAALGTNIDQNIVTYPSTRGTNEALSSILAIASEIASLIDFHQVQKQILKGVEHGAVAARRTPWAIRTLMNQDGDIKTYLFAARCMMVTSMYLVVFLSVFAASFRMLELMDGS
ncbi:MAG: hypothetical protein Q9178_005006 [Gyalolechia marmorata]